MDSPIGLLGLSAAMVGLSATLLLIVGLRARLLLNGRIARLEDSLRVYNSANAEIGRQLRAMEERLLLAATTPLPPRAAEFAAPREVEPPRRPEPVPVLRTFAGLATASTTGAEDEVLSGAAERRLAELIRARLPAARALQ